jgi:isopenicillin N synthase-like dioxygenase
VQPPVIDISALRGTSSGPRRAEVVAALHRACREAGFLQVVGHGIDPDLRRRLDRLAREFFALPEAEKATIAMSRGGRAWRGWFPAGGELTAGVADLKEGLYLGIDHPPEHPGVRRGLPLHGPNPVPQRPADLVELARRWMDEVTATGRTLLSAMAVGLGLAPDWFDRWCADPVVLLRIFRYPPAPDGVRAGWGVAEHTDYGLVTLLAQDSTGGLEVRVDGHWQEVTPVEDALVCNLGDMLERVTGGLFRSTPHRVRVPDRERISMPLFLDPSWDALVEPLPGFEPDPAAVAESAGQRWDSVDVFDGAARYGDYLQAKVSRVFPDLWASVMAEADPSSPSAPPDRRDPEGRPQPPPRRR